MHQPLILGDSSNLCNNSYELELYVPDQLEEFIENCSSNNLEVCHLTVLKYRTSNDENHVSCSQYNFIIFLKTMKMTIFDFMYEVTLKAICMNTARQFEICRHH